MIAVPRVGDVEPGIARRHPLQGGVEGPHHADALARIVIGCQGDDSGVIARVHGEQQIGAPWLKEPLGGDLPSRMREVIACGPQSLEGTGIGVLTYVPAISASGIHEHQIIESGIRDSGADHRLGHR